MNDLQVSIVTFNNERTIADCLRSVMSETAGSNASIDVVDNASTDGTVQRIRTDFAGVRVRVSDRNVGFGAAHNRVLEGTSSEFVLLLNPDATLEPGALTRLHETLSAHDDLALVGPRLHSPAGVPEVSFGSFPGVLADLRQGSRVRAVARCDRDAIEQLEAELREPFRPDWISGACMLGRTKPLQQVGLFDERFFLYLEDVDLCLRLSRTGFAVAVEPRAHCTHEPGTSQSNEEAAKHTFRTSRLTYEQKHGTKLGTFLYRHLKT
jgi:GT2 family glycosyltransferase